MTFWQGKSILFTMVIIIIDKVTQISFIFMILS